MQTTSFRGESELYKADVDGDGTVSRDEARAFLRRDAKPKPKRETPMEKVARMKREIYDTP